MARRLNKRSAKPIAQPKPTVGQTRYATLPDSQDTKSRQQPAQSRAEASPRPTTEKRSGKESASESLQGRAEQPQVSWRHTGSDRVGKDRAQPTRSKAPKASPDAPGRETPASEVAQPGRAKAGAVRPKAIGPRPINSRSRTQADAQAKPEPASEAAIEARRQPSPRPEAETAAETDAVELVTFDADGRPSDLAQAGQPGEPSQDEPTPPPHQSRGVTRSKGQRQMPQAVTPAAVALASMPESEYTSEQAAEAYSAMAEQVEQIQADPLYTDMIRKNHPADPESYDPYAAAGEPARRVHYFQLADRALAKAEGGKYLPERAEQEYGAGRETALARSKAQPETESETESEAESEAEPAVQAGLGQFLDPQALAYESNQALQDDADEAPDTETDQQSGTLISERMADQLSDKIATRLASQLAPLQAEDEVPGPEADETSTARVPAKRRKAPVRPASSGAEAGTAAASKRQSKTQPKAKARAVRAAKRQLRDPQQVVAEIMQRVQAGSADERQATFEPEAQAPQPGGLRVCDRMTTRIVCVHEDARLEQLGRLFIERGLTAVPVVKARSHKLVGLITLADLFCEAYSESTLQALDSDDADQARRARELLAQPVKDFMQTRVLQVEPDCPVQEACRLMAGEHVHHLVVTRESVVTGIFTAFDALQILAGQPQLAEV